MARNKKRLPKANGARVQHVWLVQPPVGGTRIDVTPPLGLLVLASILEGAGREAHLVDLNLMLKTGAIDPTRSLRTQFVKALPKRSSAIDLIGVTTWSYNFDVTMEFVEAVRRKHPHVPIVLGGPHVTFVDREVLAAFPEVDYVLRDEGDHTFPLLLEALDDGGPSGVDEARLAAIPGLSWRQGGDVVRNPSGPVVEDLDSLPLPAYHLIDVQAYLSCQPTLIIEAGRGCPFNCNFCSTTNMFQRNYRVKSAPRLVDEIEWTMQQTKTNRFELLHDNLVAKRAYVSELCAEIRRRNLDVVWSCTSRTDTLTEPLAEEMFLAGCESIFFGLESLDAERQNWTGKKLKPAKIRAAVELTARQHITPSLGIILGFPDESAAEFDATVGAAVRWTTDPRINAEVSTAILRYYPGASLFEHADDLAYDALAAADSASVPGYVIRDAWRDLTRLFPLQAIHTAPAETRLNMIRRNFIRALLKVCPLTFRACVDTLGLGARKLLDSMAAGREFQFLETRRTNLIWNETVRALGAVVEASGSAPIRELLTSEVPFWETLPIAEPSDELEHIVHRKQFLQEDLLALARGELDGDPRPSSKSILAIRCGPEAIVWISETPESVLETFQRSYVEDRAGTLEFIRGLRRGQ